MKIKKAVVDRIESDIAVCELEDKTFENINIDVFDFDVKEGDSIIIYPGTVVKDTDHKEKKLNIDDYFED